MKFVIAYLLFAVLMTGCSIISPDLALQSNSGLKSTILSNVPIGNGWYLLEESGIEYKDLSSESQVLVGKVFEDPVSQESYVITMTGPKLSVQLHAENPTLSINGSVDKNDPAVLAYSRKMAVLEQAVTDGVVSADEITNAYSQVDYNFIEYNDFKKARITGLTKSYVSKYTLNGSAGDRFVVQKDWVFISAKAGVGISDSTPGGQVDLAFETDKTLGDYNWEEYDSAYDVKLSDGEQNLGGAARLFWWNYRAVLTWDTASQVFVGISW